MSRHNWRILESASLFTLCPSLVSSANFRIIFIRLVIWLCYACNDHLTSTPTLEDNVESGRKGEKQKNIKDNNEEILSTTAEIIDEIKQLDQQHKNYVPVSSADNSSSEGTGGFRGFNNVCGEIEEMEAKLYKMRR